MINSVRNTVLSVLNKNNYGYISPSDFNLYAKNAQMEMYEEYFSNYNKTINYENARQSGTGYANIEKPIGETLEGFMVNSALTPAPLMFYYAPSLTTTGYQYYMIEKILVNYSGYTLNSVTTNSAPNQLIDFSVDFVAAGVIPGDIVVNIDTSQFAIIAQVGVNACDINENIFGLPPVNYGIFSYSDYYDADRTLNNKIDLLNRSNLTSPSTVFPAYTQSGDKIRTYPLQTVQPPGASWLYGSAIATYFRYPFDPKWTYITLVGGEPIFDSTQPDYQDFELPNEDEYKLSMKILQYCGISIRESEVAAFAVAQEQHEQPSFSMQQ